MGHDLPNPDGSAHHVGVLIAKHERQIRAVIRRRSGPGLLRRTTIDDLYQETVRMALHGGGVIVFKNDAHFIAWVSAIVGRAISSFLRRSRRTPRIARIKRPESSGSGVAETELVARDRTPSSAAAGGEWRSTLAEAIDLLSEEHRTVLTLYRLEERSLAEVAEAMGRTEGATAQLIRRALRALGKRLSKNARRK